MTKNAVMGITTNKYPSRIIPVIIISDSNPHPKIRQ